MRKIKSGDNNEAPSNSGRLLKAMFTILLGAGSARIIGIASIPVLTRLYSPEDYGVLALYISFITVLAPVMTLRYVQAIPLPKSDITAFNLFSLCLKLIIFWSVLLSVALILFGEILFDFFNIKELREWWWLVVLGIAGTAIFELLSMWATRKREYKVLATTQINQALIGNAVKIGLGFLAAKPAGLLIGQFLNQSAGIFGFVKILKAEFKQLLPKVAFRREKSIARHYQEFLWFRLPSQVLMALSLQAPIFIMTILYGKEYTGQLSLAIVVLSLPAGLVGTAMGKAYYAEISRIGRKNIEEIKSLTINMQKNLFFIGLPAVAFLFFFSETLFSSVFGQDWRLAGIYGSILSPFIMFQFTSRPLMEVINVVGAQSVFLIIHSLRAAGLIVIFYILKFFEWEATNFVTLISVYLSAFYFFVSLYILLILNKKHSKVERDVS